MSSRQTLDDLCRLRPLDDGLSQRVSAAFVSGIIALSSISLTATAPNLETGMATGIVSLLSLVSTALFSRSSYQALRPGPHEYVFYHERYGKNPNILNCKRGDQVRPAKSLYEVPQTGLALLAPVTINSYTYNKDKRGEFHIYLDLDFNQHFQAQRHTYRVKEVMDLFNQRSIWILTARVLNTFFVKDWGPYLEPGLQMPQYGSLTRE